MQALTVGHPLPGSSSKCTLHTQTQEIINLLSFIIHLYTSNYLNPMIFDPMTFLLT